MVDIRDDKAVAERLRELDRSGDKERAHSEADDLLCEILKSCGYVESAEVFEGMTKWCA